VPPTSTTYQPAGPDQVTASAQQHLGRWHNSMRLLHGGLVTASFSRRGMCSPAGSIYTRSGAVGNPVYVGPYGTGADPVFTGYSTLTTWVSYGGNVWGAPISGAKAYLHNVAVNGQLFHQARYPNTGYITFSRPARLPLLRPARAARQTTSEIVSSSNLRAFVWIMRKSQPRQEAYIP
jgi:hypothetical protein